MVSTAGSATVRYTLTESQLSGTLTRPDEVPFVSLSGRALEKLGSADRVPRDLQARRIRFSDINTI